MKSTAMRLPSQLPTVARLRELLEYCPATGDLTWKSSSPGNIGVPAGSIDASGYIEIRIDNTRCKGHRVAWAIHYGEWPSDRIDHVNGEKADNRIENLREATHAQNLRNRGRQINNRCGHKGVHWCSQTQKWRAIIQVDGKRLHLGRYLAIEDAAAAYAKAAKIYHGQFGRAA